MSKIDDQIMQAPTCDRNNLSLSERKFIATTSSLVKFMVESKIQRELDSWSDDRLVALLTACKEIQDEVQFGAIEEAKYQSFYDALLSYSAQRLAG